MRLHTFQRLHGYQIAFGLARILLRRIRIDLQRTSLFLRTVGIALGLLGLALQNLRSLFGLIGIALRLLLLHLRPQRTTRPLRTG